ncbi:hypothetical protein PoB_001486100 [Plakobranchus ocellatus]|uniref:Uncharacterized protein n=1 Tax=Plakobranchus ocellatus TaxID=259542 RepID=A0AAV3YM77_9GAST|nr:hypothetical protein PoB_001486100 [Plakobranchus ocellatus]
MAPFGLGSFCTAAGISADNLTSGPLPVLDRDRVTNGLVIELIRFSRIRRQHDSSIASWLISLGLQDDQENIISAIRCLDLQRDELRRKRKSADIHILEYKIFAVPTAMVSTTSAEQHNDHSTQKTEIVAETSTCTPANIHVPNDATVKKHIL